ncbi:MAG: TRAP transporter substrate-binding protein DctP [Hyphomicrobiales bacterium]|nr:TRAP transporter substrate-binding protein DctP [Hyphomicrobiales bacterium]
MNHKTTRRTFLAGTAAVAAGSYFLTDSGNMALAASPVTFRWATSADASEPLATIPVHAAKKIEERSNGRIQITVFPNEQIGTLAEVQEQASLGVPLILDSNAGFASEYGDAAMGILQGPYLFSSYEEVEKFANSDLMTQWAASLEKNGLHSVAWNWYSGQRQMIGSRAFSKPADLKGVLVRISGNPIQKAVFESLGATPVQLSRSEIYSALSEGVVNASDGPVPQLLGDKLYEVAHDITLTGHVSMMAGILVSADAFGKLDPDLQKIMTEEIQSAGEEYTKLQAKKIDDDRVALEKLGIKFHDADQDAFRQISRSFYAGKINASWNEELRQKIRDIVTSS